MNGGRWAPAAAPSVLALCLVPAAHTGPPEVPVTGADGSLLQGKPRDDVIVDVPVDPADAAIPLDLVPYRELAPRLRALQASDRVSVEIIGQSALGRDPHMVVVTSPMDDAARARWQELSDLRSEDPAAAAAAQAAGGYDGWRTPCSSTTTSTATSGRAPTPRSVSWTTSRSPTTPTWSASSRTTSWHSSSR